MVEVEFARQAGSERASRFRKWCASRHGNGIFAEVEPPTRRQPLTLPFMAHQGIPASRRCP